MAQLKFSYTDLWLNYIFLKISSVFCDILLLGIWHIWNLAKDLLCKITGLTTLTFNHCCKSVVFKCFYASHCIWLNITVHFLKIMEFICLLANTTNGWSFLATYCKVFHLFKKLSCNQYWTPQKILQQTSVSTGFFSSCKCWVTVLPLLGYFQYFDFRYHISL